MKSTVTSVRIVVDAAAAVPYRTAAKALAADLQGTVETHDRPLAGALNLGGPAFARREPDVEVLLKQVPADRSWHALYEMGDGGWVVTGSTSRGGAHAALRLLDLLRETSPRTVPLREVRTAQFRSMDIEFDDWTHGFNRMADGFDIARHARDIVRVGGTSMEVNMLADVVPVQVRERRCYDDKYQWWAIYSAALDMFVESTLNRGTYDARLLARNLAKLKQYHDIALSWGLTPTVQAFEPRVTPERFFDKYPDLRGARVDCSDYSAEAEFAMDPAHPMVQQHYRELMENLLREAPGIGRISVWSQDSCAGFPWARQLYAGPNGPRLARRRPVQDSVRAMMTALLEGGRKVNPDFQATICLAWFRDEGTTEPDEIAGILSAIPKTVSASFTAGLSGSAGSRFSGALDFSRGRKIRSFGWEPQFQVEGLSNWWKPLGPMLGVPHPVLTFDMLCSLRRDGEVEHLVHRGGLQTEVFVPRYINNEVIREFNCRGPGLDIQAFLRARAAAWTASPGEAEALVAAWCLCDEAVRHVRPLAWTLNFVSGRTLWRRLVRPLVPNQALLTWEDWRYYRHLEFNVGPTDPAWLDHFYKGWGRMVTDEKAHAALAGFDRDILPRLDRALAAFDGIAPLSDTARDVRDRSRCLRCLLTTDRNLIEVQEATHACLGEDRENPARSPHVRRVRRCIDAEIANTQAFKDLVETSPSRLIPVTSGEETTYMIKAPLAHSLGCKLESMARHRDDAPGPWFEELLQPGGWTSDLRAQLAAVSV
ncbi:MAG: hypothetical protein A3K19_13475 [Lentisphaerae bacterium RIFOXYB12_FULL_65_16]|nr:MAG: hypothetical protein A3K18_28995 [Lentisphaerae bacterium RIFOXYA12_64_32]OGV86303.1 MAG: hypothetical protein A3K19_13475 [Lentisphaerae bacterium RIFOXYB12_FULL_65_16]